MGLKSKIADWILENRSIEDDNASLDTMNSFLAFFMRQETITRAQAMDIPGFAGCLRFITETVAGLPIKLYSWVDGKTHEVRDDPRVPLLNDDTGDKLNGWQLKQSLSEDLLIDGGGYAYIRRWRNTVLSLHYVARKHIGFLPGTDPIYKNCGITVNGSPYFDHEFIKVTRRTEDGVKGTGVLQDHQLALAVAYNILRYENTMIKTGGNRRGFLKSEKKLDQPSLDDLRDKWEAFNRNPDKASMMILNAGLSFQETSATSVEMQLNERKKTITEGICYLFGVSQAVLGGNPSDDEYAAAVKIAVLPVLASIESALNRDLLLEDEKSAYFFAFDTKELLRGSIEKRYKAYKDAIDSNVMQIDEARDMENLPPLGMTFVKLGLQDVLYDPMTKEFFVPNTGLAGGFGGMSIDGLRALIGETRADVDYIQLPNGKMNGSRSKKSAEPQKTLSELMGEEFTGVKGKEAIEKLIQEKRGHVKGAFYHPEIGEIDLMWGSVEERVGLAHIISERNSRKANVPRFLAEMPYAIEHGTVGENSNYPETRENIYYQDKVFIIAYELRGSETRTVLTAFQT